MFRLTRDVRFSVNGPADEQLAHPPSNSYGGYPTMTSLGHYFELAVTLEGELGASGYLRNIKEIDARVRESAIPLFADLIASGRFVPPAVLIATFAKLRDAWPGATLAGLRLALTPFLRYETLAKEFPMTRLSQKFEFSASHRLHDPSLSEEQNRACYGKCNNPHGHGHNYELQVTLAGTPDPSTGLLVDVPAFERTVAEQVVKKFDHKNLNAELGEFRTTIPTVENIARVIYGLLKPHLQTERTRLAAVAVWETPKTWCEYSEQ